MEKTYKFPKGCSVESLTLRETNGRDEEHALRQAEQKGSLSFLSTELLRLAVVKVNGEGVSVPPPVESWNSKTRLLARAAFNKLNSAEDAEVADFLRAADEG